MANKHCFLLVALALLMAMASATQFKVGGSTGWTVPTDSNAMSYNQWAERHRFQIGDSLLFVYPPDRDSVLQVTLDAYTSCNTSSYIRRFDDGNTIFTFDRSGPYYFISGDVNNCLKHESMVVVVMADRGSKATLATPPSPPPTQALPSPPPSSSAEAPPSPSPTQSSLPPPSSSGEASPSPPPSSSTEASPPPPPSSTEVPPASAPAGESSPPPPPNGATLKVVGGFVSLMWAFFGSVMLMW